MMIMGMYVYIKHLDPGQGQYWFNAKAIKLAEGAYWDAQKGVIVSSQDQALSEAVAEEWWETNELVNNQGEEDKALTRPDNGYELAPAITGDNSMLEHKFDDGKALLMLATHFPPRWEPRLSTQAKKTDSISAVSCGSENEELHQEL
jgi:hypothetical protein